MSPQRPFGGSLSVGEVALGLNVAHTPDIAVLQEAGPTSRELIEAMRRAGETLRAHALDAAVIVSAHWLTTFNLYVNAANRHHGVLTASECPDLLRAISYDFPGDPALAADIVEHGHAYGLPVVAVDEPSYVLDYGTVNALNYLTPKGEIPVVPVSVCLTSELEESMNFGAAIRTAILASQKRVAVISSAAFAHNLSRGSQSWPTPEERMIDRHLISLLVSGGQLAMAKSLLPTFATRAKYEVGGRAVGTLLGALSDGYRGELYGYGPWFGSGNPVIVFVPRRLSGAG